MLTRITGQKIQCVYIHFYQITKNWGPGPYNSLCHADNRRYFSGLSLTRNRREAHMFYLAREVGKIWTCSCWEKGNFTMINEFKYGQTWKVWPSPLSLSLYNTFNGPGISKEFSWQKLMQYSTFTVFGTSEKFFWTANTLHKAFFRYLK